jgi:hypothetical protein
MADRTDGMVSVRYLVDDVDAAVSFCTAHQQILLEDPSGNPVEIFQPAAR